MSEEDISFYYSYGATKDMCCRALEDDFKCSILSFCAINGHHLEYNDNLSHEAKEFYKYQEGMLKSFDETNYHFDYDSKHYSYDYCQLKENIYENAIIQTVNEIQKCISNNAKYDYLIDDLVIYALYYMLYSYISGQMYYRNEG